MSSLRRLAVLSFVVAAGLTLPGAAFAGHRHSRDCGHRYDDSYGRHDERYRGDDSRYDRYGRGGYGYPYAPRYSYRPSYGYSAPYSRSYGYGYGSGGRHQCTRSCRHAPNYGGGYYESEHYEGDYYEGDRSYAPPPPRCDRRPRVGFYFGF